MRRNGDRGGKERRNWEKEDDGSGRGWKERSVIHGRGVGDWIGWKIRIDWGIQTSRELAPSVIIGYKYIRMERKKRDARFGRERRDARFGGERRDARFGDSEWLEDSGVQGACPFSHHRICTHI